jgi:hypothetical protein
MTILVLSVCRWAFYMFRFLYVGYVHAAVTASNSAFCISGFYVRFSLETGIIFLNNINKLFFVVVKCGVFFEVRSELLNVV